MGKNKGNLAFFIILFLLTISFSLLSLGLNSKPSKPVLTNIKSFVKKNTEESVITLVATGDVMLGRSVNTQIQKQKDPDFPFRNMSDFLKSADITLINLENPLVDPCLKTDSGMIFCAPVSSVDGLVSSGIDIVNLANNHSRNYGQIGYDSTISALEDKDILYSDSETLAVKKVKDTEFGFLGFDLVLAKLSNDFISTKISNAKNNVDILVVSFHWGQEYVPTPSEYQKTIARLAVESGADLIIGHHPHVIQPVEVYKGKVIVYSLGNFVFDQLWSEETRKGIIGIFKFKNNLNYTFEIKNIYINEALQPELISNILN